MLDFLIFETFYHKQMQVSVVIPTFFRPKYVLQTIAEVIRQQHPELCEIIVIDQTPARYISETFKEKISNEELQNIFSRPDTVTTLNPETYEQTIKIVTVDINPEDINRFRVKEVWFFDEETSTLRNRILGIAPIKEEYDEDTGIFKYETPLFWVYYPAVREPFSKHRVFNDFNDAAPMTWYDLFEARKFSSYIYKISNVSDMRIKDYFETSPTPGIDMLLESQRIKEELFNFEHDLWTY